jgi:hypothetical protein
MGVGTPGPLGEAGARGVDLDQLVGQIRW